MYEKVQDKEFQKLKTHPQLLEAASKLEHELGAEEFPPNLTFCLQIKQGMAWVNFFILKLFYYFVCMGVMSAWMSVLSM